MINKLLSRAKLFLSKKNLIEIKRFIIVGSIAFFIDLGTYYILSIFLSIFLSKFFSFIIASGFTYLCNKNWTFKHQDSDNSLIKFIIFYIISGNLNSTINSISLYLIKDKFFSFILATGFTMIFNFLGLKFFIFKKIKIKENNMDIYYEDKYEKFVLLTTIITVFFIRILSMQMIQDGGDAFAAWGVSKLLLYGHSYYFSHITARFGMIIPAVIFQILFGSHPLVYYIAPILASIISSYFLFKITLIISKSSKLSFFVTAFFSIFPEIVVASSQLKPEIFSTAYVLISFYFLLKFLNNQKNKYIVFSSIFMFLSYMSKIDNLFFVPGFVLIIFLKSSKKLKYSFIFLSILISLILIETVLYSIFTPYTFGQIQIIMNTHLAPSNFDLKELTSIFDLFKRYEYLMTFWKIILVLFIFSTIFIILNKETRKKYSLFLLPVLSFYFFITFTIKSLNPIKLAIPFEQRYLTVTASFVIIFVFIFIKELFILIKPKLVTFSTKLKNHVKDDNIISRRFYVISAILIFLVFSFGFTKNYLSYYPENERNFSKLHPLYIISNYYKTANYAYSNGIPVVFKKEIAERFRKVVLPIQELISKGYTLEQALKMTNTSKTIYEAALARYNSGDFKPPYLFIYCFIDIDNLFSNGKFKYPEMKRIKIGNEEIGIVIFEKFLNNLKLEKNKNQRVLLLKSSLFRMYWEVLDNILE